MKKFTDNDEGYLRWISDNPDGFVVNVERSEWPGYVVLQRASCSSIFRDRENGAYTGRGYKKVGSNDLNELRAFAKSIGRVDSSFSKQFGQCNPA